MSGAAVDRAVLLEQSLSYAAEAGEGFEERVFARFLEARPAFRPLFASFASTRPRMVGDTIELALGHANDEPWVAGVIEMVVREHLGYGRLSGADFSAFLQALTGAVAERAGPGWTPDMAAAWFHITSEIVKAIEQSQAKIGVGPTVLLIEPE